MNSEISTETFWSSTPNIIDYLIQKLESRQKNIQKYKILLNTIDSFESFCIKKTEIFQLFNNLQEELLQGTYALKALATQNKALSKENINMKEEQNFYHQLKEDNEIFQRERGNYIQKIKDLLNENNELKKRKNFSFSGVKKKKIQNEAIKPNNQFKNINKTKNNYNKTDINYNNLSSYDEKRNLKNVKSMMHEIKNNKKKLKEVIHQHLGRNPNSQYIYGTNYVNNS